MGNTATQKLQGDLLAFLQERVADAFTLDFTMPGMVTHFTTVAEALDADGNPHWAVLTAPEDHTGHTSSHAMFLFSGMQGQCAREFLGDDDDAER